MLPLEVLQRAGAEITNYGGSGMSVMEMSHRSKIFLKIFDETQEKFRTLLGVPEGYKVLFLQGGGTMQFGMIPLNLIGRTGQADYAVTGHFANLAMKEAKKYGQVTIAASSEDRKHVYIPAQEQLKLNPDASYFYYCSNNTIEGTQWQYVPETGSVPLACDMSSDILSRPVDVSKFGLIFAGAHDGARADHRVVENHGVHADEAVVLHRAAVKDRPVAHGDVLAHHHVAARVPVEDAVVLDAGGLAHGDGFLVAPEDGVVPDVGLFVNGHVPPDEGPGGHPGGGMDLWHGGPPYWCSTRTRRTPGRAAMAAVSTWASVSSRK